MRKNLVKRVELREQIPFNSAVISAEGIGGPADPSGHRKLAEYGIRYKGRPARQLTRIDCDAFDLLIGLDRANMRNMHRICGADFDGKMNLLMDYTDRPGDVADPWYIDDIVTTWRDALEGCQGLLRFVKKTEAQRHG